MKKNLLLHIFVYCMVTALSAQPCVTFEGLGPVQAKFGINVFGQAASSLPVVPLYWNRFYKANETTGMIESTGCAYPADPNIHELAACACILSDFYFRKVTPACDPTPCGSDPIPTQLPKTDNNSSSSAWSSPATWAGGAVPDPASSIAVLITKNTMIDANLVFAANHWLLLSAGNVELAAGKTIDINATIQIKPTAQFQNLGILKGSGQVLGSFTNSGILSPGNSPGKFTVVGNYTATTTAVHQMEIASAISYDTLAVEQNISAPGGVAVINGALTVSLLNGYTPASGDVYKIITYASATGAFNQLNLPPLRPGLSWAVNYNASDVSLQVNGVLPVTMVSFTTSKKNNGVQAAWATAGEINVKNYEVQRSADAFSFSRLASLPANGGTANKYEWFDATPYNGKNYYRIKAIDADGKLTFSKISGVDFTADLSIAVYPNPVKKGEQININLQNINTEAVQVISSTGQVLYSRKGPLSGIISIPVSSVWPSGQYALIVTSGNKVYTQKILLR